jgi:hypothetical protein
MCIIAKIKGGRGEWWGQFNFDDALGWQPQHYLFFYHACLRKYNRNALTIVDQKGELPTY